MRCLKGGGVKVFLVTRGGIISLWGYPLSCPCYTYKRLQIQALTSSYEVSLFFLIVFFYFAPSLFRKYLRIYIDRQLGINLVSRRKYKLGSRYSSDII